MKNTFDPSRLAALFNNSPDSIIVVDEDGQIVRANARVRDMLGYEPSELEGEPVEKLLPEVDREQHVAQRESYMEDPTMRPMGAGLDLSARRKDGTTVPVDISLSPLETENGIEVMAAIRDITEREKLRRKYRTLMETVPDPLFVADAETGELLEINQQATELVGLSEAELVGRDQTVLHPSEESERYWELFQRHVDEKQDTTAQFPNGDDLYVETASGEHIPVEISAQLVELNGQEVLIGLFRDISEQREYENRLHRQIERLETLAHVLSHDLRNPLNVAQAQVDMAKRADDVERLNKVEEAHDRIEELIDDVLTLIEEGYDVESVEPLELTSLVSECWGTLEMSNATLQVANDGIIYADSRRIKNLFENLFKNAVDHGPDDVTVSVGVYEDGFFVADNGPGIPEDERQEVFEAGWTTTGDGTGLGLNIVSEVARAHDWEIEVGESDDGGARFDFTDVEVVVHDDSYMTGGE